MDPETDVVADSSPAIETPNAAEPAGPKKALIDLSDGERHEWRKSGTLPDAPAASSTATADGQPAATAATSDPASEPAHDDPDYKPKTKARVDALLKRIKELETAASTPKPAARPAPAPAAPAPSTLAKPDPEKFTYGTADPDYLEALTDYKVASTLETQRNAVAEQQRKQQSEDAIAATNASWAERRSKAEAKYPDYKTVALAPFQPGFEIQQGSPIDTWILESEHGADVLYALMKTPAEIKRINGLTTIQQVRELTKLEDRATAPLKTTSTAPEPGPVLGVRSGDPANAAARALKTRDVSTYIREKNREELAARKGH